MQQELEEALEVPDPAHCAGGRGPLLLAVSSDCWWAQSQLSIFRGGWSSGQDVPSDPGEQCHEEAEADQDHGLEGRARVSIVGVYMQAQRED